MTHIMPKYRIAITPTTENDLHALRYAFESNMAHGEHQECCDDVLVAALLGWHLRKIGRKRDLWIKSLAYEFGMRVQMAEGFTPPFDDDEDMQKLQNLRKGSRGTTSTPGNLLTIDGIDSHTLTRIKTRAHAVERMVQKINDIHNTEPNSYMQIMETLARYSDQAIIDLGIWWTLTVMQDEDYEVEEFPYWIKDQIQSRGEARADHEAGLLVGEETDTQMPLGSADDLPPLSSRERRAFLLRRRIHPGEKFWTDERIRAAIAMGM